MRHLFRRSVLAGLAVLFGWLAMNPLIRTTVIKAVKTTAGAETSIADVKTNWREKIVTLSDVKIADPHHDRHNLMQADSVELHLDRDALLRRRAVVKRGRVDGLRLGALRSDASSSVSPERLNDYQSSVTERFQRVSGDWLSNAATRVQAGWTNEVAAVRIANELATQWPKQYESVDADASRLYERIVEIRKSLVNSGENRLRNVGAFQAAIDELDSLTKQIDEVERHSAQLEQQMRMDRESLTQATQSDALALEQQAILASLDAQALSDYLVGPEVSETLANVLHWVAWSRRLTPTIVDSYESTVRGRDLLFGNSPKANVLIESMVLQGQLDLGKGDVPLDGSIRNWSSNATVSSSPTEVVVQTGGETPMLVQAVLDRTTDNPRDRIVIDCPRMPRGQRVLGTADDLCLAVSPGDIHIWCHIDLEGERMSGKFLMRQATAQFTPQTSPRLSSPEISQALAASVSNLNSLDVSVELSGTITTPEWQLESNLGPHVAKGLQQSFQSQLAAGNLKQVKDAQQRAITQLHSIETSLIERQAASVKKLQDSLAEIEQVRASIAARVKLTDGLIDPESPLRETYRR